MSGSFNGRISIDIKDSVPDWAPYAQPEAPEGAPSVLYAGSRAPTATSRSSARPSPRCWANGPEHLHARQMASVPGR